MNMPLVLLNRRRRGGLTAFSPSTLFALAEPGVWFDPSDLTTLFTDPAGTTPVTAPGNTVGLMLDKSKGLALGAELSNQDLTTYADYGPLPFDTRTATATSLTLATATNKLAIAASPDTIAVVSGRSYRVSYTVAVVSGGVDISIRSDVASTSYFSTGTISTSGTRSFVFAATVTENVVFQITNFSGVGNYTFSNISVRELAGNHATQATLAARPTYSIEPVGGRRNALLWTEGFDNAIWQLAGSGGAAVGVKTPNFGTAPDGTQTACRVQLNVSAGSVGASSQMYQSFTTPAAVCQSTWVRTNDNSTVTIMGFAAAGSAPSTLTVTGTWTRVQATGGGAGAYNFQVILIKGATSNAADLLIWHPQSETGSTATAYQRVTTQHDVTEAGVASVSYLFDDLVSDALNWTAPAGTYSIAFVDNLGNVTIQTSQSLSGATDALAVQKLAGYLAINRALTTAETASLTEWFEAKAGV